MSNFLQEQIKILHYNSDGTMKPEYREELHRDGWSETEINETELIHIRKAAIAKEVAEHQQKLKRKIAESKARQEEEERQRQQQISQIIQRSIDSNKPFLVYAEGEKTCSDLGLLYCIKSSFLNIEQTLWLVEFLLLVLGDSARNKEFYGSRLNQVIHSGRVSLEKVQAIEDRVKQLNITLPPLSTYNSGPPIDLSKASKSEKRSFAMSGLDREELMSEGFVEADDFCNSNNEAIKLTLAYSYMQMPAGWKDVPDIDF